MLSSFRYLLIEMRPKQWTKNFFIFAAVLFARKFDDPIVMGHLIIGFIIFCAIAGTVYIINDWLDREKDRLHPEKRMRPIASGKINPHFALTTAGILGFIGFTTSWIWLGNAASIILLFYLVINILYSFWLKHAVIIDINIVAIGFILRVLFGVIVIKKIHPTISASPWLLLCTFFLALFLAAAKRRHELLYTRAAVDHRKSLRDYSEELIDAILAIAAAAAIICYSLYTVFIELPLSKMQGAPEPIHNLYFTVPLVVIGIMRYMYLIIKKQEGGAPEKILLTDRPLQAVILLWIVTVIALAYMPRSIS